MQSKNNSVLWGGTPWLGNNWHILARVTADHISQCGGDGGGGAHREADVQVGVLVVDHLGAAVGEVHQGVREVLHLGGADER